MARVTIRDGEEITQLVARFKHHVRRHKIMAEMRRRSHYIKPSREAHQRRRTR